MHPLTLTRCVTSIQEVDVGIRETLYLKPQGSPSHSLTLTHFHILVCSEKQDKPAPKKGLSFLNTP